MINPWLTQQLTPIAYRTRLSISSTVNTLPVPAPCVDSVAPVADSTRIRRLAHEIVTLALKEKDIQPGEVYLSMCVALMALIQTAPPGAPRPPSLLKLKKALEDILKEIAPGFGSKVQ